MSRLVNQSRQCRTVVKEVKRVIRCHHLASGGIVLGFGLVELGR